ncbi:MAG: hypothetical protein SV062_09495 [Thermodesulfobacteriota bacterium]|nr:hypothetical protein [Thermodesulfobacteriota bacterium]
MDNAIIITFSPEGKKRTKPRDIIIAMPGKAGMKYLVTGSVSIHGKNTAATHKKINKSD